MRTSAITQRNAERDAARAEYEKCPKRCDCGCGNPVPWNRWKGGGRFASQICSRPTSAEGNKRVKHTAWHCYVALCADGSYYTGIAVDVAKRIHAHNHTANGAKYTRTRRPVTLAYVETFRTRTDAARREAQLKKLSHREKAKLWTDGLKLGNG